MKKSKLIEANKKIENTITRGFGKIEETVIKGYTKIEDAFVERYLINEGESIEDAKKRLKQQQNNKENRK